MEWDLRPYCTPGVVALPSDQRFKADGGKSQPSLLERDFVHALRAVQATLDYGARKYSARSWKNVAPERYDDAARRHRIAVDMGSLRDPESNLLHRAHQIVCELMILQGEIEQLKEADPGFDFTTFNEPPQEHKK